MNTDTLSKLKARVDDLLEAMDDEYAEADYHIERAKQFEDEYCTAMDAYEAEMKRLV